MRFSASILVTLLPVDLTFFGSIVALPAQEPSKFCTIIKEPDYTFKWYDRRYLKNINENEINGIGADEVVNLNGNDFHFQAASYYNGYDFIKLDTDRDGTGQFKISFIDKADYILTSVWATNGAWCKLPTKLDTNRVSGFAIWMRKFK
jgi:hypothetical protein